MPIIITTTDEQLARIMATCYVHAEKESDDLLEISDSILINLGIEDTTSFNELVGVEIANLEHKLAAR